MDAQFFSRLTRIAHSIQIVPWRRLAILSVLWLCASGCGVKLMYNNLDRIARWSMSDYLKMDSAQRAYFNEEFAVLLYWHRTTQLPEYADFLESLEVTFADGTDSQEMRLLMDELFIWGELLEARVTPMAIEMMLSMSHEQVARLPELLIEDNERLREDEVDLSIEEIQKEWSKDFADGFGRLSGRLTGTQKDYLDVQSQQYVPQFEQWADYRWRWQVDVLDLLVNGREEPDKFAASFVDLAAKRKSYYGEELTAVFDHNEKLAMDVTVWLINHLEDKQRKKLFKRFASLAEVFRELVAEAPATAPPQPACLAVC